MEIDELFKKRLLRKINFDVEKVNSSLRIAESKIEESKKLFSSNFFSNAVLSAYTSMFHSARSLLYKEGIQEKSHYATYIYTRDKFKGKISKSLVNSFNVLREERHKILYGFVEDISKKDAESYIADAENFLFEVKKIIGELSK
ncbi:MAG: HEPN domain-containing protein [Nanoarchaeota archaeon]